MLNNGTPVIIVAAIGTDGEIGYDNKLPWKLKSDLKNFKNLTSDHIVLMGRKTYESIGKPLPNRINIVISSDKSLQSQNTKTLFFESNINEAFMLIQNNFKGMNLYVIGGGKIYTEFLIGEYSKFVDECFITHVYNDEIEHPNMVYFPEIKSSVWKPISESQFFLPKEGDDCQYQIIR